MKNIIRFISLILACVLSAACLFAACSHGDGGTDGGNGTPPGENRPGEELPELPEGDGYPSELFSSGMYSPSKVGMSAEYLGTAERRLPEVSNGGLSRYPAYGVDFSAMEGEPVRRHVADTAERYDKPVRSFHIPLFYGLFSFGIE